MSPHTIMQVLAIFVMSVFFVAPGTLGQAWVIIW